MAQTVTDEFGGVPADTDEFGGIAVTEGDQKPTPEQALDTFQKLQAIYAGSTANPDIQALGQYAQTPDQPAAPAARDANFYRENPELLSIESEGTQDITPEQTTQYGEGMAKGFQGLLPRPSEEFAAVNPRVAGMDVGLANMLEGLPSMPNAAIAAALPAAPAAVGALASAYFAGTMGKDAFQKGVEAIHANDPNERSRLATEAVLSGVMALGAGAHAFGRPSSGGEIAGVPRAAPSRVVPTIQAKSIEALTGTNPNTVEARPTITPTPETSNLAPVTQSAPWSDVVKRGRPISDAGEVPNNFSDIIGVSRRGTWGT